jgi:hypothetical protein
MLDALLGEIRFGKGGEERETDTVLDDMVLGERGEASGRHLHVEHEERNRLRELVLARVVPLGEIAEDVGQEVLLERFLEVLVSLHHKLEGLDHPPDGIPPLGSILQDVDGRALVIEVGASGLQETAHEEKLEELFRVLEELQSGTGLDELGDGRVDGGRGGDQGEMEEEGVAEG